MKSSNAPGDLATAVGMICQLTDGTIRSCNHQAKKILGYSASEMLAVAPRKTPLSSSIVHPAIAFVNCESVRTALTGKPCFNTEMLFDRPDGSSIWLSLDSQPLFGEDCHRPSAVITTFKDITAAKNQLRELEANSAGSQVDDFQIFANGVPGIIYLFDAISQRNIYLNSQSYDSLGYTPEDVLSMGDEFTASVMHPDDFARFPAHMARLERSQPGEVVELEYRMRHRNGEWRWFSSQDRVYSRTRDGRMEQILGIARNIHARRLAQTALEESEARLKLATTVAGMGMWFWDLVKDTLEFTEQGKAILGLKNAQLSYAEFLAWLDPQDRDRIDQTTQAAFTNKTDYQAEYRVLGSDGSIHWILAKGESFYNSEGEPIRMMGTVQNITSVKRSQQQSAENEGLLRLALANAKAGTWDWDLVKQEVTWSPENYQLYGIEPQVESVQYADWEQSLHPDDLEQTKHAVQQVLSGGAAEFRQEFRIIHPQRGTRWLLGIGNLTYQNGQPIRLSGINLDISDLKQTEMALRYSKQQLRILLDSLPIFAGFLTPEGIVTEVNQTALDIAGLQPEDVLQRDFRQTYWWSYDSEIQAQIDRAIERAAAGKKVRFDITTRIKHERLTLTDFGIVPKFDAAGKVEYLVPFGMDVSDREASRQSLMKREREIELITKVIPQQIWTAGTDGQIDYINQRWQDYTGLDLKQMRRRGWSAIVHPEDLHHIKNSWIEAVKTGGKFDIEVRLRSIDGSYSWFLSKARPLRNEQGEIVKWYGTNTGITRIKELEEKLLQQTKDLTNANQLKDEFLAIVSHELRTPLNPILGWSQLLATGLLDESKTASGIEIIERNAKSQAKLIDDLLDVSRILRDKLNLNKIKLDLESIIRSALTTIQLAAEAKSIQIKTELKPVAGRVLGDPVRLQQVVWNLVSNAIKFTPEAGQIFIELDRVGTQAQIDVRDTGQGIDPEFLPYVFDRFRQAESSSTRQYGGLGLGLAIVRHLSELHGGTVAVSSQGLGRGSTFSVKLPLINTFPMEPTKIEPADNSVQPNRFSGINILVVDDEVDSLEILTMVLQQEGAEVISVSSAQEALEIFARTTPRLIISDIGMPHISGYDLMTQIRALPQGQNIPAIALTAYAGEIDRQHSLAVGFQQHLAKPINIPELILAIDKLV